MECKLIDALQMDMSMLSITGADIFYNRGITGQDVTVAVIDTGLAQHEAIPSNRIIGGRNFTSEGTIDDYTDFNGHGTHVAGIIGAEENRYFRGMAPKCKFLILKVLDRNGSGSSDALVRAVEYAVEQNVDIINMSLGTNVDDPSMRKAIQKAVAKNISVCCAAGNSGDGNASTMESDYPGAYEEVICVGAMTKQYSVAPFSNSNRFVDLVAPGKDILSTYLGNGYVSLSGTSMATPVVSGALALLLQYTKKEFGRRLLESELYGLLIKCTKTLKVERSLQGNGYLSLIEYDK